MQQVLTHLKFSEKANLASLKSGIDKVDINKIETTPVDLSKLTNVVQNEVVKETACDKLVKKVYDINFYDTSGFVQKKML